MRLDSENCRLNISYDRIDCQYEFILGEDKQWILDLEEEQIQYKDGERNRVFESGKIKEFWFEIEQNIQKAHNLTQIGVAYIIDIDSEEPTELFRICVKEEIKPASQTKSYKSTENILKNLSSRYNKPYFFKYSIPTKQKTKSLWVTILLATVAAVIGTLLAFWI